MKTTILIITLCLRLGLDLGFALVPVLQVTSFRALRLEMTIFRFDGRNRMERNLKTYEKYR